MILILSDANDKRTAEVCNWLKYLNAKFLVLNEHDIISIIEINSDKVILNVNNEKKYACLYIFLFALLKFL
jgi:hypothetical protein